jgi:hypothetical protein
MMFGRATLLRDANVFRVSRVESKSNCCSMELCSVLVRSGLNHMAARINNESQDYKIYSLPL